MGFLRRYDQSKFFFKSILDTGRDTFYKKDTPNFFPFKILKYRNWTSWASWTTKQAGQRLVNQKEVAGQGQRYILRSIGIHRQVTNIDIKKSKFFFQV